MNSTTHNYFFQQIFYFNKRTYLASLFFTLSLLLLQNYIQPPRPISILVYLGITGTIYFTFSSLFFSYLIYDCSDLYKFNWLKKLIPTKQTIFLNVYSGYTEAGHLLQSALTENTILHLDFYNEQISTTNSIKVAKKLSRSIDNKKIQYNNWQFDSKTDTILFMQSLHELLEMRQQIECLQEAKLLLVNNESKIIIVEHLCDLKNFLIYSIGAFHFFGKKRWQNVINEAGLIIEKEINMTPFIKVFVLKK